MAEKTLRDHLRGSEFSLLRSHQWSRVFALLAPMVLVTGCCQGSALIAKEKTILSTDRIFISAKGDQVTVKVPQRDQTGKITGSESVTFSASGIKSQDLAGRGFNLTVPVQLFGWSW